MKTVYFNVLPRISTELSTKNTQNSFCKQKIIFSCKKIWFSNFAYYFQEASQEVWKQFILTFYSISVPNYLQKKPPIFRFASKKLFFFWQRIWFSNFAYYIQEASQEVWKPFILTFYPVPEPNYLQKTPKIRFGNKNKFSGKKFDFQILLFTFKKHQRRYENRLFYRSFTSQYRIIYKNIQFSFC